MAMVKMPTNVPRQRNPCTTNPARRVRRIASFGCHGSPLARSGDASFSCNRATAMPSEMLEVG